MIKPSKHWCFIGEIIENITVFRPGFLVKDKDGEHVTVHFYLDTAVVNAGGANFTKFKKGSVMCVYYAHMRNFIDGNVGIRVEDMSNVKVNSRPLAGTL